MQFDQTTFEHLGGLEASVYSLRLVKEGISNKAAILAYFKEAIGAMAIPHLEVAVFLLANLDASEAWEMVADHLSHQDFRIRFVAVKTIKQLSAINESIMRKLVALLSTRNGDEFRDELQPLLNRPANSEAQRIAQTYLAAKQNKTL